VRGPFGNTDALGNATGFTGPALGRQFECVWREAVACLPDFAAYVRNAGIANEKGLNGRFSIFLEGRFRREELPYLVDKDAMEDEADGRSPAPDMGVYIFLPDSGTARPKITVIECKRLSSRIGKRREKEYVIGHDREGKHRECGGMERYKKGLHGREIKVGAMLLAYMQTDGFAVWHERVNGWICELARERGHSPAWRKDEMLSDQNVDGIVATSHSRLYRETDQLRLRHIWVDLT